MERNPTRALAGAIGLVCGIAASLAQAGEWAGRATIDKLVIHPHWEVSVYKASEVNGQQEDWPNPDACDDSSRVILRPFRDDLGVLTGMESYEQAYAALLGAKLNGHKIAVLLNGCALFNNVTVPLIEAVAIK